MRISSLYRYPMKGFSPERLARVMLEAGAYFPADRMFAVENGPAGFDVSAPTHQPKIKFLMLMKNDEITRLETRFDDVTGALSIHHERQLVAQGDLATEAGRAAIATFLTGYVSTNSQRGPLRVLAAPPGFRFTDSRSGFVSVINMASVAALEERLGVPVDPLRFRGNIMVDGLGAWQEFDLVGQEFETVTGVRLRISKRIDRCAATAVDPQTGIRDLPIVKTLMSAYGHVDCGVYAEIISGGPLSEGQRLMRVDDAAQVSLGLR